MASRLGTDLETSTLNSKSGIARRYHQTTKHSLQSLRSSRHFLDWRNEPLQYKIYQGLSLLPLPTDLPVSGKSTLSVLRPQDGYQGGVPGLVELAYLLYYCAGVTKKLVHPGGEIYFRAAASAGALYPIEVYIVCGDLPGLAAGVYHFNPARFGLHRLREGDHRFYLFAASGQDEQVSQAPLVLVFSGLTWRTSWKYQARSYRYHYWDCGTMLANALAAARAINQPAKVVMGFVDHQVDRLIGIDGGIEKSLCLLPVGDLSPPAMLTTANWDDLPPLHLAVRPLSNAQVDYPLIEDMHAASNLDDAEQVSAWRGEPFRWEDSKPGRQLFPLQPADDPGLPGKTFEEAVLKRGSSRRFQQQPIRFTELSTLLLQAAAPFSACWLGISGDMLNDLYLSVHAVDGLTPGLYVYHRKMSALELLQPGDFRGQAAHLCLGQDLGGDASVTIFFLADLNAILGRYGNRGYRLVQMEAGITGGNLYLGAYALGRGASGLTFFDDEVVHTFSSHSDGMEAIFVVALGVPAPSGTSRGRIIQIGPGGQVNVRTHGGML
jgi:SagB-type dehydrogenase family enzyme